MTDARSGGRIAPRRRFLQAGAARAAGIAAVAFACGVPATRVPGGAGGTTALAAVPGIDSGALLRDIGVLAHDSMGGRRTGSAGSEAARRYLVAQFTAAGLRPLGDGYTTGFDFTGRRDSVRYHGTNVVGYVRGTRSPDRYIVVSAHYDHLGTRGDTSYNGADDDASGTAAVLALARHFARQPAAHSLVFVAFDAEELGLQGARAFVAAPPVPREAIALDVNMDMVSRNAKGELYAAGTYHYPALRAPLDRVASAAPVKLVFGHDRPGLPPGDDWTQSSDHGPFHAAKIPFVYFGVEDHPDYHKPTDDVERIEPGFYVRATRTVLAAVQELDAALAGAAEARATP
jgi:hypothetical protein